MSDLNVVVGTTRRGRFFAPKVPPFLHHLLPHVPHPFPQELEVSQLKEKILDLAPTNQVGLLFGKEDSGLSNEDLQYCDYTLSLPSQGSLNLSQAVLAIAYDLYALPLLSFFFPPPSFPDPFP